VTIPPGGKPIPTLAVHTYGAQLAGVSVTIDAKGISINNQVAVPPDALSAFKAGLDQLAAQGLTFCPSPMQTTTPMVAPRWSAPCSPSGTLPGRIPAAQRHRDR